MNQGLEILFARARTHPEEFVGYFSSSMSPSKWVINIENFQEHMTEEEKAAWVETKEWLDEWNTNRCRDEFTEHVMKELLIREGLDDTKDLVAGMIRFNQVLNHHEKYDGKKWVNLNMPLTATLLGAGGGGGNGGGYGGGNYPQGGGGGSVVVKTPTGTHTFTKNGVVTVESDEQVTWLPKP